MKIIANSKEFNFDDSLTVSEFIEKMGLKASRCVVELNSAAMCFGQFKDIQLKDGDVLEVMQVVAGG